MSRTMQRPSARVEASRSEAAEPSSTPSVVSLSAPKRKRPSWVLAGVLLVGLSALTAILALAPVALHRAVFHRGVKPIVVRFGHRALIAALIAVATPAA